MPLLSRKNKHSDERADKQERHTEQQGERDTGANDSSLNKPLPEQGQQGMRAGQQDPRLGQQDPRLGQQDPRFAQQDMPQQSYGGHSTAGKVENAVIGSNALKGQISQKQREADAIHLQSQELAEAERLEHEALIQRERAVAHGAHPQNKHLGGDANTTVLQGGTGGDMSGAGMHGYDQQDGVTGAGHRGQAPGPGYGAPGAGGVGPRV